MYCAPSQSINYLCYWRSEDLEEPVKTEGIRSSGKTDKGHNPVT